MIGSTSTDLTFCTGLLLVRIAFLGTHLRLIAAIRIAFLGALHILHIDINCSNIAAQYLLPVLAPWLDWFITFFELDRFNVIMLSLKVPGPVRALILATQGANLDEVSMPKIRYKVS